MFKSVRNLIPASARGRIHAGAGALAAVLLSYGLIGDVEAAALAGVLVAVADLGLATLHARNKVRVAGYALAAAVTGGAVALGFMSEVQSVEVLALVAAVLGTGGAAALAPLPAGDHARKGVAPVEVTVNPEGRRRPDVERARRAASVMESDAPGVSRGRERETPDGNWGRIDGED